MSTDESWCPTQSGTYTAYMPQWLDGAKWRDVQVESGGSYGVPQPMLCGGINLQIGLYGYAQAQALAWAYAAHRAAQGETIEVRAQAYEMLYNIKARAKSDEEK